MYQDYDISEEKKALFETLYEILVEIDRVCKKNNIKYFAFWGTMLGAIRHHGFIPWDDDLDIAMFREDYERFVKICPKELNEKFFLQTALNDKGFYRYPARIRKNDTTYLTKQEIKSIKAGKEIGYNCGVFASVVPLDFAPRTEIQFRIQEFLAHCRNQILVSYAYTGDNRIVHRLLKTYCTLVGYKNIYKRLEKSFSKYSKTPTKMIQYPPIFGRHDTRFYYDDFKNIIEVPFEGIKIPCPEGYDRFLTWGYGDYMSPPDKKTQDYRHGEFIDLKTSYKDMLALRKDELLRIINTPLR